MTPCDSARGFLNDLMNMDEAPSPRMPQIENLALLGPVGVPSSCCTMRIGHIVHLGISRRSHRQIMAAKPACRREKGRKTLASGGPKKGLSASVKYGGTSSLPRSKMKGNSSPRLSNKEAQITWPSSRLQRLSIKE